MGCVLGFLGLLAGSLGGGVGLVVVVVEGESLKVSFSQVGVMGRWSPSSRGIFDSKSGDFFRLRWGRASRARFAFPRRET